MSRARPVTSTDKDFGRRLYASDKGYTEQMKEVTDKAMLDIAPFHLSEFKKPYIADSYEEMEHMYSPMGGPVMPVIPPVEDKPESRTSEGVMSWKTKPPAEGEGEHWYLVEVWNRVKEQTTIKGGKITKYKRTYYPAQFSMKNVATGTKGFKLEVWLPNITYSVDPFYNSDGVREVRIDGYDLGHTYRWFDTKEDAAWIKRIFTYMQSQGDLGNVTTARLTLDADADGEVEIAARDGKTELKERVRVIEDREMCLVANDYIYKISDIISGSLIPYTNISDTVTQSDLCDATMVGDYLGYYAYFDGGLYGYYPYTLEAGNIRIYPKTLLMPSKGFITAVLSIEWVEEWLNFYVTPIQFIWKPRGGSVHIENLVDYDRQPLSGGDPTSYYDMAVGYYTADNYIFFQYRNDESPYIIKCTGRCKGMYFSMTLPSIFQDVIVLYGKVS